MFYSSPKYNQQQPFFHRFRKTDGDNDEYEKETFRSEQNEIVDGVVDVVAGVREKSRSSTP
ncbi:hypothetical protein MTR_7g113755 [Medicago truncatula]|uniref:Uncharacterized protein n=1 Tax=Medicago truncatula TaxID=3880 RepID=Q2HTM9_MEDTR|nr:hypothetical protein MtrDRAFT_AC150244g14v2 [Medicago truncatula]KEH24528.1 hypothetical protein MTR_7g113755 [Medicago truncatula]